MNVAIAPVSKPAASSRWKPIRSASYSFSRVKLICDCIASAWAEAMPADSAGPDPADEPGRRNGQRERRQRVQQRALLARERARHVVLRHVRDFVRQHRRELGLALRQQDETGVDADVAARQREGVDRGIADGEELEVLTTLGHRGDEPMAELVQIVVDLRVVEIAARTANLPDDGLAEPAFLPGREHRLRFVAEVGQRLRVRNSRGKGRRPERLQDEQPRRERRDDAVANRAERSGRPGGGQWR